MPKQDFSVPNNLVLMAEVVGVHGVRGVLKLKIHSDYPEEIVDYSPLVTVDGQRQFELLSVAQHGHTWLAEVEGVSDRTAAEKLKGIKLYVERDVLPDIEDEGTFYYVDLIGLVAKDKEGAVIGKVINVANFGAGDLLEIKPPKGGSFYLPFNNDTVPDVDLAAGEIAVVIPPGLLD